jgi:hypothetical protein
MTIQPATARTPLRARLPVNILIDCIDAHALIVPPEAAVRIRFNKFNTETPAMMIRTLDKDHIIHCTTDIPLKAFEKISFDTPGVLVDVGCEIGGLQKVLKRLQHGGTVDLAITMEEGGPLIPTPCAPHMILGYGQREFMLPVSVSTETTSAPGIIPSESLASVTVGTRWLLEALEDIAATGASTNVTIRHKFVNISAADNSDARAFNIVTGDEVGDAAGDLSTGDLGTCYDTGLVLEAVKLISSYCPTAKIVIRKDRHLDLIWRIGGGGIGEFTIGERVHC